MTETLHQVYLMASDLDASVQFYRNALGLTLRERGDRSARFDTGECELVLERDYDEETLAAFGLSLPGEDRGEGVIVVLDVADVDAVHESVRDAGEEVLVPPRDVDWGRRLLLVEDPDGYVLEVSRPTE